MMNLAGHTANLADMTASDIGVIKLERERKKRMTETPYGGEKALIIKAKGGLGNRMLSAVSGLIYADLTGRIPVVDWRDGTYAENDANAYPLLFDTPLTTSVENFAHLKPITPSVWEGHLDKQPTEMIETFDRAKHSSPTIYRKYCVDLSKTDQPDPLAVFWCYLPKMPRLMTHLKRQPKFRGQTEKQIVSKYLETYFTPNARVRQEVSAFMSGLPRPVIGVHIRYTDRKISLDKVKRAMRRRLADVPHASLFLATDNADVQEEISAEFDRVYFTPKYLPPAGARLHDASTVADKQFEAENAMIDMWALAACDHLVYSKNSTFSVSSALIGALDDSQQDDVDRFNLPIVIKRFIQARI